MVSKLKLFLKISNFSVNNFGQTYSLHRKFSSIDNTCYLFMYTNFHVHHPSITLGVVHKVCTQKNWKFCPPPPVAGSTFPAPPKVCTLLHTPGKEKIKSLHTMNCMNCHECHRLHVFGFFQTVPRLRILL